MPASTRDHVPAKALFDGKRRPHALVFPSCMACQQTSKRHELVAAMMARLLPDPSTQAQRIEVQKYIRRAGRAVPGLLEEMVPTPSHEAKFAEIRHLAPKAAGAVNFGGPLIQNSMEQFSVKLNCALYYEHTGRIPTSDYMISVREFSNADAVQGQLPDEALRLMGEPMTLRQGKWSVPEQFFYQYVMTETQTTAAFFSGFRQSFAVLGIVWGQSSDVPDGEGMPTYRPVPGVGFVKVG